MTTFAARERDALSNTLLAVGPDAPTLCEGWQARDLAAHLVLREHSFVGSMGIWLSPLKDRTARFQAELADEPWDQLVEKVRARPAIWHPARLNHRIESLFDNGEYFIHHEDLRRGDGEVRPRTLSADDQDALWRLLNGVGKLAFRKSPVGIVAVVPGRSPVQLHRSGSRQVTLRGAVGEVVLTSYGRGRAADVEIDGSPEDILALHATQLGL
jgi:uncharacterized protein (TIGR03085 family)